MSWVRIPHRPVNKREPLGNKGFLRYLVLRARRFWHGARRIARRLWRGFDRLGEVRVENLQVVFLGDSFAVAEPSRDDVTR